MLCTCRPQHTNTTTPIRLGKRSDVQLPCRSSGMCCKECHLCLTEEMPGLAIPHDSAYSSRGPKSPDSSANDGGAFIPPPPSLSESSVLSSSTSSSEKVSSLTYMLPTFYKKVSLASSDRACGEKQGGSGVLNCHYWGGGDMPKMPLLRAPSSTVVQ
ncbi:unnamed protein product [Ectocarpus sp. 8 AP-2014]